MRTAAVRVRTSGSMRARGVRARSMGAGGVMRTTMVRGNGRRDEKQGTEGKQRPARLVSLVHLGGSILKGDCQLRVILRLNTGFVKESFGRRNVGMRSLLTKKQGRAQNGRTPDGIHCDCRAAMYPTARALRGPPSAHRFTRASGSLYRRRGILPGLSRRRADQSRPKLTAAKQIAAKKPSELIPFVGEPAAASRFESLARRSAGRGASPGPDADQTRSSSPNRKRNMLNG
jgi:hypothetical protein